MTEQPEGDSALKPDDIVFECPHCGKSLAIDEEGAGLVVICPDCQARVQVPGEEGGSSELVERLRVENIDHFEEIGKEIGLIQSAIDRIVGILQDGSVDNAPPPPRY